MTSGASAAQVPSAAPRAWPMRAGLTALLLAFAAFLVWQYLMPAAFESSFLLDHVGLAQFREVLGISAVPLPFATYRAGFRLILGALWAAYFVAAFAGFAGARLPRPSALVALVAGVALVTALAWPPSFSCDVYGYVAYGRLQVLYGMNPYVTTQKALRALGDPTGRFLIWNIGSPYGPLWTALSAAVVWLTRGALFAEVVVMKLVAGGAVVVTALFGRRIAERLAAGRGDLTLMAIGLNPLFVIEGAGNGHNDFVMMAFVVASIDAALAGRTRRALLLAGLGGAVKFLPLALVPWILLRELGSGPAPWGARVRAAAAGALTAALPLVVAFLPYWAGRGTLRGLEARWTSSQTTASNAKLALAIEAATLLATYLATTVWAARGEPARLLSAWMIVAGVVFFVAAGVWLPWYVSWIWIVALLRWDGRKAVVSHLAFCLAVVLTLRYSVPSGG